MRKIYFLWLMRQVANRTTAKLFLGVLLLWQFSATVSVPSVFVNMRGALGDTAALLHFMEAAVANTEAMTLVLLTGIILVFLWTARDFLFAGRNELFAHA